MTNNTPITNVLTPTKLEAMKHPRYAEAIERVAAVLLDYVTHDHLRKSTDETRDIDAEFAAQMRAERESWLDTEPIRPGWISKTARLGGERSVNNMQVE